MDQERLAAAAQRALVRVRAAGASKEQAEDCVQDAVVDLLAGAHTVERPEAWLTTVSRRRFADQLRRGAREQTALARTQAQSRVLGGDPAEAVADRDQARWMAAALDELPATTREVVTRTGAGVPAGQIAAELGLSDRSVESHLTRARRLLRRLAAAAVLPAGIALAGLWRWLGASKIASAKVALAAVSVPVALGTLAVLPSLPGTGPTPEPPNLAVVDPPQENWPPPPPVETSTKPNQQAQPQGAADQPQRTDNGKADPPGQGRDKDGEKGKSGDKGKGQAGKPGPPSVSSWSFGWSHQRSGRMQKSRQDSFAGPGRPGRQHSGGRTR